MDEPHQPEPDGRDDEVLNQAERLAAPEREQTGVDMDVEPVVVGRRGSRDEARRFAVGSLGRREFACGRARQTGRASEPVADQGVGFHRGGAGGFVGWRRPGGRGKQRTTSRCTSDPALRVRRRREIGANARARQRAQPAPRRRARRPPRPRRRPPSPAMTSSISQLRRFELCSRRLARCRGKRAGQPRHEQLDLDRLDPAAVVAEQAAPRVEREQRAPHGGVLAVEAEQRERPCAPRPRNAPRTRRSRRPDSRATSARRTARRRRAGC